MNKPEREARLIELWNQRPAASRTSIDAITFHGWVREHHPELLRNIHGDSQQWLLHTVLRGRILE